MGFCTQGYHWFTSQSAKNETCIDFGSVLVHFQCFHQCWIIDIKKELILCQVWMLDRLKKWLEFNWKCVDFSCWCSVFVRFQCRVTQTNIDSGSLSGVRAGTLNFLLLSLCSLFSLLNALCLAEFTPDRGCRLSSYQHFMTFFQLYCHDWSSEALPKQFAKVWRKANSSVFCYSLAHHHISVNKIYRYKTQWCVHARPLSPTVSISVYLSTVCINK